MSQDEEERTQLERGTTELERKLLRKAPTLRWKDAGGKQQFLLTARHTLGSGEAVEVRVQDKTVSRLHCELELRDDGVWVTDLGSSNGTYVESVRVSGALLSRGARLRVGRTELELHAPSADTELELWPSQRFGPLLGRSTAMRELFARLARVAPSDATVLLHGETGTGKELVAQALHEASPRAKGPFVVVDCAALPENLIEAELFGHARGAFTGAVAARAGAFETAEGGTVFLDELGELPPAMQPRLLRVLESRTVRRVGETMQRKVNVRFVAATHRDLRRMVNDGQFREDLYFRLALVTLVLPPLRSRMADVPLLVEHFLAGRPIDAETAALFRSFAERPWVGNVRELRNSVERALLLGAKLGDTPAAAAASGSPAGLPEVSTERPFHEVREQWIAHVEREYLRSMLEKHNRNVTAVAQASLLNRTYLHRLLRKYDL